MMWDIIAVVCNFIAIIGLLFSGHIRDKEIEDLQERVDELERHEP